MSEELFEIPEALSPRLAWIKENNVLTHYASHLEDFDDPWTAIIPMEDHVGTLPQIMAEWCRVYDDANEIGYGATEDDAIVDLAKKLNLKLWNE